MAVELVVDGRPVTVERDQVSLLEALRDEIGSVGPKDGCSPQGQCGCCTVLVDGQPRVACVTAVRRVAGRSIVTIDGLPPSVVEPLAESISAAGGSQCGFCTPGIICRLAALGPDPAPAAVDRALLAHLCRCTGWQGIREAALRWRPAEPGSSRGAGPDVADGQGPDAGVAGRPGEPTAARRARIEGRSPQSVGLGAVLGRGGFAADTAPAGALVAVPDPAGGWAIGESLSEARAAAGARSGRRSGQALTWPVELPAGDWALTLRTTWVEPGYLEPDTSWCVPGGGPASPLANGGAFGGKLGSPVAAAARRLADEHGRPVRAVMSREDVVRMGPKRPPVAIGVRADGTGAARAVRTAGIADAIREVAPGLLVDEVDVVGPPTSSAVRAAGWAEAAMLLAALRAGVAGGAGGPPAADGTPTAGVADGAPVADGSSDAGVGRSGSATVRSPDGSEATATVELDPAGRPARVGVAVDCGEILDDVVLRSYVVGAAHMGLGWVCSEGLAVDRQGHPVDLTIRSWGILRAVDMPPVDVELCGGDGPAVNGSDAAFVAVAAATWIAYGCPPELPAARGALQR